ncbi:MAG: response regulator transcription factor [Chloroflexi bacterium]|nr:response regulator transcription factor [Chloroflexota bacterium]
MDEIKLMIAEDEPVARQAMARLFDLETDIDVVGEAENGEVAVDLARRLMPDVILMDIRMPKLLIMLATQIIKQEMPKVAIVILTIYDDDTNVFQAIKAGAIGYILKDSPIENALDAVRAAYRGEGMMHPAIAGRVMKEFARLHNERVADMEVFADLTDREREVLKLLASSKHNNEIAEALFISEKTVKNHVSNILFKLQANDRTEAALYAAKHGLVD